MKRMLVILGLVFFGGAFSAKGDSTTNAVHTVIKAAFMGKTASNELVRISQDASIDENDEGTLCPGEHPRQHRPSAGLPCAASSRTDLHELDGQHR